MTRIRTLVALAVLALAMPLGGCLTVDRYSLTDGSRVEFIHSTGGDLFITTAQTMTVRCIPTPAVTLEECTKLANGGGYGPGPFAGVAAAAANGVASTALMRGQHNGGAGIAIDIDNTNQASSQSNPVVRTTAVSR